MSPPGISLVILARNRAHHLERLLDTFLAVNTHVPFELIIVEKGETDNVDEVLSRFHKRAFIRLIKTGRKDSPACLWNIGVGKARYPFLLFLQDNVIYASDVLPAAVSQLNDQTVGAVGVRIDEDPEALSSGEEPSVLNAGIHFVWNDGRGYFQPEQIRHPSLKHCLSCTEDPLSPPPDSVLPAVAGGFLLCRKVDFETLDGFCEDYELSLEDIDFCLRLGRDLNKVCRCVHEVSLLRLEDPARDARDSYLWDNETIGKDHRLFKEKWDNYVRRLIDRPEVDVPTPSGQARPAPAGIPAIQVQSSSLNVLFVLHGSIDAKSGVHVLLHADRLESREADCLVAVPTHDTLGKGNQKTDPRVLPFDRAEKDGVVFRDGRGPDIVHAWTPREIVRRFCENILLKYKCPLIVHLEDNEEYLTEATVGRPFSELETLSLEELDEIIYDEQYHPVYGRNFLDQAQGLSMVIDTLGRFNKKGVPRLILPPPVDERLFYPRPLNLALRKELGISEGNVAVAYTGSVHLGNAVGVHELYKAVDILNRQGCPAVLLRTGSNGEHLGVETWERKYEIYLGWVDRARVPEILAAADVLVEPGIPGPGNDQRIPSKLPEYFAMGKAVILPRTNIGVTIGHRKRGYVVDDVAGTSMLRAILEVFKNEKLNKELSSGAVDFYLNSYSVLLSEHYAFYKNLLKCSVSEMPA